MGIEKALGNGFVAGRLSDLVGWARKYSLWPYPYGTACCSIEFLSVMNSDYDISRFGAERPSFSPRQADMLMVLGTITYKMAPVLWKVYHTMLEPKWVISVGACASSGGMFNSYAVLQGIDRIIPVDLYVPGCPPRPEMLIDALIQLQNKVSNESINDPKYQAKYDYLGELLQDVKKPVIPTEG